MGIISRLLRRRSGTGIKGKTPTSEDIARGGWNTLWGTDIIAPEGPWKTQAASDREAVYTKHDIVSACIYELMTSAAAAPRQVGIMTDDGFEPRPDHPVQKLIDAPNVLHDSNMVTQYQVLHLMTTGASFTWKIRANPGALPTALWPVPTSWVKIIGGDNEQPIAGYRLKKDSVIPLDMAYMWFPDPQSIYKGLGPVQRAARAIEIDEGLQTTIGELLDNLDLPGLIVKFPAGITPDQRQQFEAKVKDRIGKGKRGSLMVLQGEGADATVVNILKDFKTPDLTDLTESRICMCLGVPLIVVGARLGINRSTYANYMHARKSLYRETMLPLWASMASADTRSLLRDEGDSEHIIRFDTSGIEELKEDQAVQSERARGDFEAGVITRNEAREVAGYEPLETAQGDVFMLKINMMEVPLSEAGGMQEEEPEE
jgi:HK97 family phage portal protein